MTAIKSPNYEVGYRKPPRATRFRKGQSGNPRGRKPESENFLAIFKRQAMRRVKIKSSDGISKTLSVAETIIAKNYQSALTGDQTAMANVMKLAELGGEFLDRTDAKVMGGYLFMPEPCKTAEEFEALLAEQSSGRVKVGRPQTDD